VAANDAAAGRSPVGGLIAVHVIAPACRLGKIFTITAGRLAQAVEATER
jgi:hypothetical protein